MSIQWGGATYQLRKANGYYWAFFSKKDEKIKWHFMGDSDWFDHNSSYTITKG